MLLADRAYSHREAVGALIDNGVKVVVRLNSRVFPLLKSDSRPFEVLGQLRRLRVGQLKEWNLHFGLGERIWPIRLCAIRKSHLAAEQAKRKARRNAQRHQVQIQSETLEFSQYILVLTNLDAQLWSAGKILELYRCRWQVELAFKRLKSLLKLGHLPKKDPASARAWMQLKLLLALITEKLCYDARFFSPGDTDWSISRWAAWLEMTESVLMTLRCPLPLPTLIEQGPRLRRNFEVIRPQRPLQIKRATEVFLS